MTIRRIDVRTGIATTDQGDAPVIPPTAGDVMAERDRRIRDGTTIDVDGTNIRLTGDDRTINRITAMYTAAQDFAANSIPQPQTLTDANGVTHTLTPAQVIDLAREGYAWVQAKHQQASALLADIPDDLTNDSHWS